ncbi:hypothetical protein EK904_007011 [Melospiza melodia maxima]|nr:hypothetical protein EK904_007011 [Melospiza melodia maxima]
MKSQASSSKHKQGCGTPVDFDSSAKVILVTAHSRVSVHDPKWDKKENTVELSLPDLLKIPSEPDPTSVTCPTALREPWHSRESQNEWALG